MTKLLYLDDTYKFESTGKILKFDNDSKGKFLILDQTIFYPQGGGQPSDSGQIIIVDKKITFDIECSNKTKVLFKDCLDTDVKSLRVILKYLKNKSPILTYPNYNCYVNTNLKQHQYICTHLLVMEHMQLIFIQSNDKKIEFAWDGFGKCLKQPNVKLNFDLKIH